VAGRCLWIEEGKRSRDDFAVALMTP
jgi:hypothetical protein